MPFAICSAVNAGSGNSLNRSSHVGSQKPSHFFPGVRLHILYVGNSFSSSAFSSGENIPRWVTTILVLCFLAGLGLRAVWAIIMSRSEEVARQMNSLSSVFGCRHTATFGSIRRCFTSSPCSSLQLCSLDSASFGFLPSLCSSRGSNGQSHKE